MGIDEPAGRAESVDAGLKGGEVDNNTLYARQGCATSNKTDRRGRATRPLSDTEARCS